MRHVRLWLILPLVIHFFAVPLRTSAIEPNTLSEEEKRDGFELLFNGRDFTGWENRGEPEQNYSKWAAPIGMPQPPIIHVPARAHWKIDNGVIYCIGGVEDDDTFEKQGLYYTAKALPENFELRFAWKVDVAGLKKVGKEKKERMSTDATFDIRGAHGAANGYRSACIYFAAGNQFAFFTDDVEMKDKFPQGNIFSTTDPEISRKAGEWNQGRFICNGQSIEYWQNGQKTQSLDPATMPKFFVKHWKLWMQFKSRGLHLKLHSEGFPAWYRDIKLRTLPEKTES